jgi:inhibitor of cysteine peptidase
MKTKIQTISVIILLVSALVITGCTSASSDLEIGAEANGTQVELKAGQALVISLASNPTTGYGWHIADIDESILKQVGEAEFVQESNDEQLVGAGGVETLRFEAVSSGTTTLSLTYDRARANLHGHHCCAVTGRSNNN